MTSNLALHRVARLKFLHFSEGLIEFYPRSGLTGIVEIYRICGTEGNVAVENIHIYMYITGKRGIYEC